MVDPDPSLENNVFLNPGRPLTVAPVKLTAPFRVMLLLVIDVAITLVTDRFAGMDVPTPPMIALELIEFAGNDSVPVAVRFVVVIALTVIAGVPVRPEAVVADKAVVADVADKAVVADVAVDALPVRVPVMPPDAVMTPDALMVVTVRAGVPERPAAVVADEEVVAVVAFPDSAPVNVVAVTLAA